MPTSSHIFYIPLVFVLGIILGVVLGRRSAVVQLEEEKRLEQRKAARKGAGAGGSGTAAEDDGVKGAP